MKNKFIIFSFKNVEIQGRYNAKRSFFILEKSRIFKIISYKKESNNENDIFILNKLRKFFLEIEIYMK